MRAREPGGARMVARRLRRLRWLRWLRRWGWGQERDANTRYIVLNATYETPGLEYGCWFQKIAGNRFQDGSSTVEKFSNVRRWTRVAGSRRSFVRVRGDEPSPFGIVWHRLASFGIVWNRCRPTEISERCVRVPAARSHSIKKEFWRAARGRTPLALRVTFPFGNVARNRPSGRSSVA